MCPLLVPAWQQVPLPLRWSYWEGLEEERYAFREALDREAEAWTRNPQGFLEAYAALPGSFGGRLHNADLLATLLPSLQANPTQGYEALEDPACRAMVHLNTLGKRVRDRALEGAEGRPVMVLMGGQASGKTTGALALGEEFGAVVDAPHTEPEALAFTLRRILAQEEQRPQLRHPDLHLAWVHRSPEGSLYAMLERAVREGRFVPLDRLARTHAQAPHAFLEFAPLLDTGVHLYFVHTRYGKAPEVWLDGEAVQQAEALEKPTADTLAHRIQDRYLQLLRNPPNDTRTWYPRDVLAGLNRTLDPWRRPEADHLLQRLCEAMARGGPEGGPAASGGREAGP